MPAEAEDVYVLSPSDVRNIRSYVQIKYAAMPQEKKAEIVTDAVTRIIHRQLPELPEAAKKKVTVELIRNAVLEQQRPVRAEDILQVCLKLDRSDETVIEPVRQWTQEQLGLEVDKAAFVNALDKLDAGNGTVSGDSSLAAPSSRLETLRSLLEADPSVVFTAAADKQPLPQAEIIPLPTIEQHQAMPAVWRRPLLYGLLCFILFSATLAYGWTLTRPSESGLQPPVTLNPVQPAVPQDGLPADLRYTEIDKQKLANYLQGRSSLLAEEPYLSAIIETAKSFDIHPLLLFAITGQEQGFVPTTNKQAEQIANNPFNVFHSWKEYNTDISDSAAIASRTIVRLSKGRPEGTDPITWINREYAEDPNWSVGVRTILEALRREVETPG